MLTPQARGIACEIEKHQASRVLCKLRELGLENTFKHLKRIRKVVGTMQKLDTSLPCLTPPGESNENLLVFLCLNSQRNDKKIEQLV